MGRTVIAVALVVTAVSLGAVVAPGVVGSTASDGNDAGDPGPTPIDGCTVIGQPGRYVLTDDVRNASAGQCLRVRASDVVVAGEGHRIGGTGAFGTAGVVVGSWASGVENVTVRDLTVTDWDDAVRLTEADRSVLANVTTAGSRIGVVLRSASENRLTAVRATGNAVHGVSLTDDSDRNHLREVTATGNALFGVHLAADASANRVRNATVRANEYGVVLVGVTDNRVVGGSATDNRIAGVWLSAADDNRVAGLRLSNRFYGVFLADEASGNEIRNNVAEGNAVGFRLRNAAENRLAGNVATDGRDGLLFIESDRNLAVENRVVANRRGVSLLASDDNRFRDNEIRSNDRNVLLARGSRNNSLSTSRYPPTGG